MKRILSIDIIRGIVMVIMALDHTRDLIHVNALNQSPTDLSTTTPLLFMTRWVTYLCAPIFVFLAGTSAFLSFEKTRNIAISRSHLIKRGLWLILIDLILVNFLLYFDLRFNTILFSVVASIGFGLIILGTFLRLPSLMLGILGTVVIAVHDLYGFFGPSIGEVTKMVMNPLLTLSVFPLTSGRIFIIAYPPIPWLGILLLGFSIGKYFVSDDMRRNQHFIKIGILSISGFLLLRMLNSYGDSQPWTVQKDFVGTFLSFINVSKYPPSLSFTLVTLGLMFLLLGFADHFNPVLQRKLAIYGKVPLFYYIIHFLLIHLILLAVLHMQGIGWSEMNFSNGTFGRPKNVVSGLSLYFIYLIWIAVVSILYFPCNWYRKYKETHDNFLTKYI